MEVIYVSQYFEENKFCLCFKIFQKLNDELLGVVKRNPLFLHEIDWKNNGFFFTTPNIYKEEHMMV